MPWIFLSVCGQQLVRQKDRTVYLPSGIPQAVGEPSAANVRRDLPSPVAERRHLTRTGEALPPTATELAWPPRNRAGKSPVTSGLIRWYQGCRHPLGVCAIEA